MGKAMSKIETFQDLRAWQVCHELVMMVYNMTKQFPDEERFGLTSQIRRAAVSVTSNIAEGFSRFSYADKARFYQMAQASHTEVQNQLIIAKDVGYIEVEKFELLLKTSEDAYMILQALIRSTKQRS